MKHAWKQLQWEAAVRARAIALACRLDRQLEEAAAVASGPESRLAARLRAELQAAATGGARTEHIFQAVDAVHRKLAFLPKPSLPTGVRVFLRELFGRRWDDDVVVSVVSIPRWPIVVTVEGDVVCTATSAFGRMDAADNSSFAPSPEFPVSVIPRAELRNPLMWPLIALQGANIAGWSEPAERVRHLAGPGVWFAIAEALVSGSIDSDGAPDAGLNDGLQAAATLWERGRRDIGADDAIDAGILELAESLADGVLISARRVGASSDAQAPAENIYSRLAAVRDVPAEAMEILSAGWIHWYGHAAPRLLEADDWQKQREIVDGLDDVLCRSLDVAAIHRFYATEGASM